MKYKNIKILIVSIMITIALTACGEDEVTSSISEVPTTSDSTEVLDETSALVEENEIVELEKKLSRGELAEAEYIQLSNLYQEDGRYLQQRNILEQSIRLFDNEEMFSLLQKVTVNVAEEDNVIQEAVERLQQNLSISEYVNEGVGMLFSADWFDAMMPKLDKGHRNYYVENENSLLVIEAGYDESGAKYSSVWNVTEENKVTWILQRGEMAQMFTTGLENGVYKGEFESWLVYANRGDVYHETGTIENGTFINDYSAQVRFGTSAIDFFSLWNTKEDMDFVTYIGHFDANGITTLEQPSKTELNNTNGGNDSETTVVYAYDEQKENYLFVNTNNIDASSFVFAIGEMGIRPYPVFTKYEPKPYVDRTEDLVDNDDAEPKQLKAEDIKIRVYDSNIEWFDGTTWHIAGSVEQFVSEDPLAGAGNENEGENEVAEILPEYERKGGGKIINKTTPTKKPTKPTKPTTPTPTPEPTPTPTPAPNPAPAPDPTPAPNPDPEPTPPPAPEPNGGDTDIEWSEDYL